MTVMPFDWIWRMPTDGTCAWLALVASKVKAHAMRVKVWRGVFIQFFSWVLLWLALGERCGCLSCTA